MNLRRLIFIVVIVVLVGVVFYIGFIVGNNNKFLESLFARSTFEEKILDGAIPLSVLTYIEQDDVDKAKSILNAQLDSLVLELDVLMKDYPDEKDRRHAMNMLARIARYREKHPVKETGDDEYDKIIKSILIKALKEDIEKE